MLIFGHYLDQLNQLLAAMVLISFSCFLKKLLEEKQQGREENYQQGMEHLLEQLTAEYHKSTGY